MAYIVKPLVTEKMTSLTDKQNKFGFVVRPEANKLQIKDAVEKLFNVKVQGVNTLNIKPKNKRFRMSMYKTSAIKKAIVKLKAGESITAYEG